MDILHQFKEQFHVRFMIKSTSILVDRDSICSNHELFLKPHSWLPYCLLFSDNFLLCSRNSVVPTVWKDDRYIQTKWKIFWSGYSSLNKENDDLQIAATLFIGLKGNREQYHAVQYNIAESPQFSFCEEMSQNEGLFQLYLLKASNRPDTKEGKPYAQLDINEFVEQQRKHKNGIRRKCIKPYHLLRLFR